jgi:hypothetical protein
MRFNSLYSYLGILLAGIMYYITLAPEVVQIDAGELSAVQYLFGTAHPTGYPLFTLLGWLATRIIIFDSVIQQLNFLALIYGIVGLVFFRSSLLLFLGRVLKLESELHRHLIAGSMVLTLALQKTYWSQHTATEVYALHVALLQLSIWCILRAWLSGKPSSILWLLPGLSLGLGFSNHLTTLMILPALGWLYFSSYGFKSVETWKTLGKMIGIFVFVLLAMYGLLMFRAAQEPILNWGNPDNLQRLLTHVSGWQYRVWLFSSTAVTKENMSNFFSGLFQEYFILAVIPFILGIITLFQKSRAWALFFVISFLFTVMYASNYDIHDLDSYFLMAYISAGFLMAAGWAYLLQKNKIPKVIILSGSLIPAIVQGYQHYTFEDRSQEYSFRDYTIDAFATLPKDAIVFSYQWDFLVSPSYYYQFVEGHRRDVCMIDKELLRRSWYYGQMGRLYPDVMGSISNESAAFIEEVRPMEQGSSRFNAQKLENLYRTMITGLMERTGRPVYVGIEMMQKEIRNQQIQLPVGYSLIPDRYFLKLIPDTARYQALAFSPYQIRFSERPDSYTEEIRKIVATMSVYRALYEKAAGFNDRAIQWRDEALRIKPNYALPPELITL